MPKAKPRPDEGDTVDVAAPGAGRAMRVAQVLSAKRGDEFSKPGNLVEVKFVKGQSLSLTASRLLALMILTAGGDAWLEQPHKMRKADIRRGHKGNERISEMLEELHRTLFAVDDLSWRGRKATRRFSLILTSREEADDEVGGESGWIEWEFTPDARRLIQESETYAVLNRQAVLGFKSTYSLKLYELGALRIHRRQSSWRGDMVALRAALGIAPEIYSDFAQLRRKVLEKAKSEIDQLAHFTIEWQEFRRGRTVAELELRFLPKDAPVQFARSVEVERNTTGREACREAVVEVVVAPAALPVAPRKPSGRATEEPFPDGSIRWSPAFAEIARRAGGGWDIDLIASTYREHMGERLFNLRGVKLMKSWQGFCEAFLTRRGRPG